MTAQQDNTNMSNVTYRLSSATALGVLKTSLEIQLRAKHEAKQDHQTLPPEPDKKRSVRTAQTDTHTSFLGDCPKLAFAL